MNKLPKEKKVKIRRTAIAFCALAALIPLAIITIGLHKNNHEIVKLGFAGSVLTGMGIGMTNIGVKKSSQCEKEHN